jgi:23S rRNA (guanosine2251-2'-O)-methyltransferase
LVFVLDHLRSGFNVGSLFRLADCVGAEKIWLVGYTATPEQKAVQDTALGTSAWVPWQHHDDLLTVIRELQAEGYKVIALETAECAQSLFAQSLPDKLAFVVGNERFGLGPESLAFVDEVRSIPMQGLKNSLNVASALSVAAFEWGRQHP